MGLPCTACQRHHRSIFRGIPEWAPYGFCLLLLQRPRRTACPELVKTLSHPPTGNILEYIVPPWLRIGTVRLLVWGDVQHLDGLLHLPLQAAHNAPFGKALEKPLFLTRFVQAFAFSFFIEIKSRKSLKWTFSMPITNTEFMRFRYFTGTQNQLQWRCKSCVCHASQLQK